MNPLLREITRLSLLILFASVATLLPAQSLLAQETTILFVYNPGANTGATNNEGEVLDEDFQLIDIIENTLGYNVELRGATEVQLADTAIVDAIFISESVGSGDVVAWLTSTEGTPFGNYGIPVIAAEVFIYDDLHWIKTGPSYGVDVAYGFADADRVIVPPDPHQMLGGLRPGPVRVYDEEPEGAGVNQVGFVVPQESAEMVLAMSGNTLRGINEVVPFPERRATLFTYEEGDVIPTPDGEYAMRARRVGIFPHTRGGENLSEVGARIVANAIAWALGDEENISPIEAPLPKILYVYDANQNTEIVEGGSLRDEDLQMLALIEDSLGFEAVAIDQGQVTPADTAGVEAMYVSESVGSGTFVTNFLQPLEGAARYGNLTIPIVASEAFVWDDMQWIEHAPSSSFPIDVAWGFAASDSIIITALDHPITTGLEEGYAIPYLAPPEGEGTNQVGYAVPKASADILATVPPDARVGGGLIPPFDADRATLFTYNAGDVLFNSDTLQIVAKSRRAGFFAHTRGSENMSVTGQQLFLNTLRWATGQEQFVTVVQQTSVSAERTPELPETFAIESVYPNPFNPSTTISLSVQQLGDYRLRVLDMLGRLVEQRDLLVQESGQLAVNVEMSGYASGMYLIQVTHRASGRTAAARAMLLK